jgi:hypothetical protein
MRWIREKELSMGSYDKKLLLAVDGAEQSFEAVRYVSQLFPPKRLEVVLFHVMTKIPDSFWDIEKSPQFRHKLLWQPGLRSKRRSLRNLWKGHVSSL